jgi:type IV pilus assembly protein PilN
MVMGGIIYYFEKSITEMKQAVTTNKALLASLQKEANEARKYEKLNKEIQHKGSVIENLRRNQSVPVRVMEDVGAALPEGVWLNALIYKDNAIVMEGYGLTNINVVAYVENLKKTAMLNDATLQESRQMEYEKQPAYRFSVNIRIHPSDGKPEEKKDDKDAKK